jgi:hypothetical protein
MCAAMGQDFWLAKVGLMAVLVILVLRCDGCGEHFEYQRRFALRSGAP